MSNDAHNLIMYRGSNSVHDFLHDWTACDLLDNYLWPSFHDLRTAVSYMLLCFTHTHVSLSVFIICTSCECIALENRIVW